MELYPAPTAARLGTYDAMVVVPAYREDVRDVEALLRSADLQVGIDQVRYGVLVVINNAAGAGDAVRQVNHDTYTQLCTNLEDRTRWERLYGHVYVADLYSKAHAPEQCNVGVARRMGSERALRLLTDEGVLHGTDADTTLGLQYIAGGQEVFRQKPSLSAATGPLEFVAASPEEQERYRVYKLQALIRAQALQGLHDRGRSTPLMSGSNMTMRAAAYQRAGGFADVAGAEDTLLSCAIVKNGGTIGQDSRLRVRSAMRLSDRTDPRCGFGQQMLGIAAHETPAHLTPSWSRQHAAWYAEVLQAIAGTKRKKSLPRWVEFLLNLAPKHGPRLSESEAELLASRIVLLPPDHQMSCNGYLLRELQHLTQSRFATVPLGVAISAMEQEVVNDDATDQVGETLDLIAADHELLCRVYELPTRPPHDLSQLEIQLDNLRRSTRTVELQQKITDGRHDMAQGTSRLVPSAIDAIEPLLAQVQAALPLGTGARTFLDALDLTDPALHHPLLLERLAYYARLLAPVAALGPELLAHSKLTSKPEYCHQPTHVALQVAETQCRQFAAHLERIERAQEALTRLPPRLHPKPPSDPPASQTTSVIHPA